MNPILIAVLIAALAFAAYVAVKWLSARKHATTLAERKSALEAQHNALKETQAALEIRVDELSKYEDVHDAFTEAEQARIQSKNLLEQARSEAAEAIRIAQQSADEIQAKAVASAQKVIEQMHSKAASISQTAKDEAARIRSEADAAGLESRKQRERLVKTANDQARQLIERANQEAQEIAGAAWEAKRDAEQLEKTAKAMKNVIKGYGDEYLIPNIGVLDELAEDFSHKDAGVQLKSARARTRAMIKDGGAATCDYVEARRKSTAIHFVIDAFNGKVEAALAKVKYNNYGKLKQEIEDAFRLVNLNGEAFRNAQITPQYLQYRLEELRWGVAANELKRKEREEQRQIKEAMREEERARREYEKTIKQVQKEERLLEKAMAEARKQLETAKEEQRLEYEAKLAELQHKWEEAEAKNQRALSMAQQTRRRHVYVISNVGSFGENVYKIGLTRRLDPMDRVKELGDASVPFPFDVHAMLYSEDAPTLESQMHRDFDAARVNKVNSRKEFFQIRLQDVREYLESKEIETHWTMVAEATEYRESLTLQTKTEKSA